MFGRKPTATPEMIDTSLGKILLRMGVVSEEQLATTLARKADDDAVIGALLKEQNLVDEEQLQKALDIQRALREGRVADATLDLMEMRLDAYGAGEKRLTKAIDEARGVWVLPLSPTG